MSGTRRGVAVAAAAGGGAAGAGGFVLVTFYTTIERVSAKSGLPGCDGGMDAGLAYRALQVRQPVWTFVWGFPFLVVAAFLTASQDPAIFEGVHKEIGLQLGRKQQHLISSCVNVKCSKLCQPDLQPDLEPELHFSRDCVVFLVKDSCGIPLDWALTTPFRFKQP